MSDFDITSDTTVDAFLASTLYDNSPSTHDRIFVSEGATLRQTDSEIETVLYTAALTLGENSTGTALVKDGNLEITKQDFELYISYVPVVWQDALAPAIPRMTTISAVQETAVSRGQTLITVRWDTVTLNEQMGDYLGQASGTYQTLVARNNHLESESETVFEITGYDPFGGDTTLVRPFSRTQDLIEVADSNGFHVGQIVEVADGARKAYYRLLSEGVSELRLETRCNFRDEFPAGSTVKTVSVNQKTRDVDYSVDYTAGKLTLENGAFAAGSDVFVIYGVLLSDLHHYELYRVSGDHPVTPTEGHSRVTLDAVTHHAGYKAVSRDISPTATSITELMPPSANGESWTFYLFAVDDESPENSSFAASVMLETIPSVPQEPQVALGDRKVYLSWSGFPASSDLNTDGYNVYRCDGADFDPSRCVKVNSVLIDKATPFFDDSADNTTNRRSDLEVPIPQNGQVYTYRIEAEDTDTSWDVGTRNEDVEGPANLVAVRNL